MGNALYIIHTLSALNCVTTLGKELHIILNFCLPLLKLGLVLRRKLSNAHIISLALDILVFHSTNKLVLHRVGKLQLLVEHVVYRTVKHPISVTPQDCPSSRVHFGNNNISVKVVAKTAQLLSCNNGLYSL